MEDYCNLIEKRWYTLYLVGQNNLKSAKKSHGMTKYNTVKNNLKWEHLWNITERQFCHRIAIKTVLISQHSISFWQSSVELSEPFLFVVLSLQPQYLASISQMEKK